MKYRKRGTGKISIECVICKKVFVISKCYLGRKKYCSNYCRYKGIAGISLSKEHKIKISEALKGKIKSVETRKRLSISNTGKHLSNETKEKLRNHFSGSGSNTWKGGISKRKNYKIEKNKEWRNKNKDLISFYVNKRRVFLKNNGGFHTIKDWKNLKLQYNLTCLDCKKQEPKIKLSIDHIIPISKGGSDNIENIQPLCRSCNSKKGIKILDLRREVEDYFL